MVHDSESTNYAKPQPDKAYKRACLKSQDSAIAVTESPSVSCGASSKCSPVDDWLEDLLLTGPDNENLIKENAYNETDEVEDFYEYGVLLPISLNNLNCHQMDYNIAGSLMNHNSNSNVVVSAETKKPSILKPVFQKRANNGSKDGSKRRKHENGDFTRTITSISPSINATLNPVGSTTTFTTNFNQPILNYENSINENSTFISNNIINPNVQNTATPTPNIVYPKIITLNNNELNNTNNSQNAGNLQHSNIIQTTPPTITTTTANFIPTGTNTTIIQPENITQHFTTTNISQTPTPIKTKKAKKHKNQQNQQQRITEILPNVTKTTNFNNLLTNKNNSIPTTTTTLPNIGNQQKPVRLMESVIVYDSNNKPVRLLRPVQNALIVQRTTTDNCRLITRIPVQPGNFTQIPTNNVTSQPVSQNNVQAQAATAPGTRVFFIIYFFKTPLKKAKKY